MNKREKKGAAANPFDLRRRLFVYGSSRFHEIFCPWEGRDSRKWSGCVLFVKALDDLRSELLDPGRVVDVNLSVAVGVARALLRVGEGNELRGALLHECCVVDIDPAVAVDVALDQLRLNISDSTSCISLVRSSYFTPSLSVTRQKGSPNSSTVFSLL